jgi:DNA-binding MarR family transcriptional regulator
MHKWQAGPSEAVAIVQVGDRTEVGMREHLQAIERELTLLGRHQMMVTHKSYGAQLDRSAYLLLTRLEIEGPMSVSQLAEAFGLDTSTVTRQTAAMLRSGLAERIPDPEGGMARKLRVTALGTERLAADRAWAYQGLQRVLDGWPPQDVQRLAEALAQFNNSVEQLAGRARPQAAR